MKILMLHGYAQNSDTFQRKMRRLEERLRTTFPNTEFAWPEGALRLQVSDITGHDGEQQHQNTLSPDLRAWFHLRYELTTTTTSSASLLMPWQSIVLPSQRCEFPTRLSFRQSLTS